MNPGIVGTIVFACSFGGALFGIWRRTSLPPTHVDAESKETVRVCIGLVATMTALVLGLITASAKNSFDAMDRAVKQTAVDILALDRVLARYGPETGEIRQHLQVAIGDRIEAISPQGSSRRANLDPIQSGAGSAAERLADAIHGLEPHDDYQRGLQSRALDLTETLLEARWLVLAGTEPSVPVPFLVILLFWLAITFSSYGIFAPRNTTVIAVFTVCALSVGSAVFLLMEMDGPFDGLIRVSLAPLRYAYAHMNQ